MVNVQFFHELLCLSQTCVSVFSPFLLLTFTQDVETFTLFLWKYLQKKAKQKIPTKQKNHSLT